MHPDSGKTVGFLNKIMHLVRGHASTTGGAPADSDSLSAREVLQESMVRKRRNEAIRQHEFAQLRLLRQRHEEVEQSAPVEAVQDDPLSSLLGQETRSTQTLQKIDAIEAQMSGQWWRNPAQAAGKGDAAITHRKLHTRQLPELHVLENGRVVAPATSVVMPAEASSVLSPTDASVAHASETVSVSEQKPDVPVFKPHPDLEEAAILFAHGDVDGARTRLLEQLVQVLSVGVDTVDEEKAAVLWHAVLDVCRATGDEDAFEPLAIDYAEHFGRSAPLWLSMPSRLGMQPLYGAAKLVPEKRQFQWSCPSVLTVGAVTALRIAQEEAPQPWSMSWLRLTSVDEAALAPLAKLFDAWASSLGQFVLSDAGRLLQVLQQHTPVGDRSYASQWWTLRMAVLRLMYRADAYEQVALDYCITYEESPPSWVAPCCDCMVQEEGQADVTTLQEASTHSLQPGTSKGTLTLTVPSDLLGLSGVIEGDPQVFLDALTAMGKPGQVLEVTCENLIRLDFVAAGSVLNWAAEMQNQGYTVRFTQLHQLVAVFFHVIGIHEHASVEASIA